MFNAYFDVSSNSDAGNTEDTQPMIRAFDGVIPRCERCLSSPQIFRIVFLTHLLSFRQYLGKPGHWESPHVAVTAYSQM